MPARRTDEQGNEYEFDGIAWKPVPKVDPARQVDDPAAQFGLGVVNQMLVGPAAGLASMLGSEVDVAADVDRAMAESGVSGSGFYEAGEWAGFAGEMGSLGLGALHMAPAASRHVFRGATTPGGRIGNWAKGKADEIGTTVRSYRSDPGAARGAASQPGSAGAAAAPKRRLGDAVGDADLMDEWTGGTSNAQRAFLNQVDNADDAATRMKLRREQNSPDGQNLADNQNQVFGSKLKEYISGGTRSGPLNKTEVSDIMEDVIGPQFDELEAQFPQLARFEAPQIEKFTEALDDIEGNIASSLKPHVADPKTFVQQIRRAIIRADKAGKYDTRRGLENLLGDVEELRFQNIPENLAEQYREVQKRWAYASNLLNRQTTLNDAGKLNIASFRNDLAKRYKPFATGQDMSDTARAVRGLSAMETRQTVGSNTFEKLMENARANPAGVATGGAAGLLGGMLSF